MATSSSSCEGPQARVILQQCLHARLQVQPAQSSEQSAQFVEIDRGLVVYICFMKGASLEIVDKIVKAVLNARLSSEGGKLVSVLDLPGDVLIVPQATLGGKLKGKVMQYHTNIDKCSGLELYTTFTQQCQQTVAKCDKCRETNCMVKCGTYGNVQVLTLDTNGPYSHVLEF